MIMAETTPDIDALLRLPTPDPSVLSEALVRGYAPYLYHLACSILNDPDDAQDSVQDSLLRALQHIHSYLPDTNLKSWLTAITVNICRDHLRRQAARQRLQRILTWMSLPASSTRSLETHLEDTESSRQLWRCVQQLSEKHRLPILLRFAHGMPISEIALILGLSEGTVHSRLHYGLRKLRSVLSQTGITPPGSSPMQEN